MTDKELREIRRRFRPEKNNILNIRGCIVNADRTDFLKFNQPIAASSVEESEKLLGIMKKAISGGIGTNLLNIEFASRQPAEDEHHKLLMALRSSELRDEGLLVTFYKAVAESVKIEGGFAILLAEDKYDVFSYSADGEKDESSEVFNYIICCVCPIKPLNTGLYFREYDSTFRSFDPHAMLAAPELGFMFPCFDDRSTNIYNALFYTRDVSDSHPEFISNIFNVEKIQSSTEQKENFSSCLKETLNEDCDFEVMRSVHGQIIEMVKEHKDSKTPEPLTLSKEKLKTVLEYCGASAQKVEQFGNKFEEQFGKEKEITPKAIVDVKKFEVVTPDVSIKVNPERTDLDSTQIINGVKYILIKASDGVEVNGMSVDIK